jgi:hypothetical protein
MRWTSSRWGSCWSFPFFAHASLSWTEERSQPLAAAAPRACATVQGMRQDLTVQHLRTELTVSIYEAHARAALEYGGDPAEYNQCQTQLNALYAEGLRGCRGEFTAYWLLYGTMHAQHGEAASLLAALRLVATEASPPPPLPRPGSLPSLLCLQSVEHRRVDVALC